MHVACVALHHHGFVVANKCVHRAAGLPRLFFQLYEQVHRFSGIWAAIRDVPELHQSSVAAAPAIAPVDEPGVA
jgi:hypothetical protein